MRRHIVEQAPGCGVRNPRATHPAFFLHPERNDGRLHRRERLSRTHLTGKGRHWPRPRQPVRLARLLEFNEPVSSKALFLKHRGQIVRRCSMVGEDFAG